MDISKPPPEIGPHEGRELELMLARVKPLAYFSELVRADFEWPDDAFEPHVRAGRIIKREFIHREILMGAEEVVRSVYFALPGEEWRIDQAHANRVRGYRNGRETEQDSQEMGDLLGYTNHEIMVFISWRSAVRKAISDGAWTPPRTSE